ncbi:hypothetical protein GCM10028862_08660 [Luteimonas pelagia]
MPFFEVGTNALVQMQRGTLAEAEIHERRDLQRLLRAHICDLVPDILVTAEEFGEWEDSRRRIDLLGLDKQANLVVIELKRGETGVHMELQAVRYAAMVSTMTFDQAVSTFASHLGDADADARGRILEHLGWSEPQEDEFGQDVRIVLFCENYSRELTSSILWLNGKGLDITAFRVGAYRLDQRLLLDFQQIIPLKEAEDYQVKVRNKQLVEQTARRSQVSWNGEFYANYGGEHRSWDDARKFGFISAGGREWFSRTLKLLEPGGRVWVNRPGAGYIGVGEVLGPPVPADEFKVDTSEGQRRYFDVGNISELLASYALLPERKEYFVPVRWLKTVDEKNAIRETGLFGNQNSAAKPTTAAWISTVETLKARFGLEE